MEQPIHFEELCRRMAPVYGRQKATSIVRDNVRYIFRNHLQEKIIEDKDGFIRIKILRMSKFVYQIQMMIIYDLWHTSVSIR